MVLWKFCTKLRYETRLIYWMIELNQMNIGTNLRKKFNHKIEHNYFSSMFRRNFLFLSFGNFVMRDVMQNGCNNHFNFFILKHDMLQEKKRLLNIFILKNENCVNYCFRLNAIIQKHEIFISLLKKYMFQDLVIKKSVLKQSEQTSKEQDCSYIRAKP